MSFRQVSWYTLLQLGIVFVRSWYLRDRHETELFITLRRGCGSSWIFLVILTCKKTCKVQYQPWACCVCRQKVLHVLNMFHSNKRKFYFETWQFSVNPPSISGAIFSCVVTLYCSLYCFCHKLYVVCFALCEYAWSLAFVYLQRYFYYCSSEEIFFTNLSFVQYHVSIV